MLKINLKHVLLLFSAIFIAACGLVNDDSVNTTQNIFEADDAEPCAKVVFPSAVKMELMQKASSGAESVIRYNLKLQSDPHYEFSMMKLYNAVADAEWALVPLSDQYSAEEKLYEIIDDDYFFERSAVVVFIEKDNGMYLRGIIGEYTASDKAVFFTIDRMIHRSEYMRLFDREEWLKTASGKFFVEEMKKQTDWYFKNITITGCKPDNPVKTILAQ